MPTVTPLLAHDERRVLQAIRATATGSCPRTADISRACELPPHRVLDIARHLHRAGWIRTANHRRAIEILNPEDGSDT